MESTCPGNVQKSWPLSLVWAGGEAIVSVAVGAAGGGRYFPTGPGPRASVQPEMVRRSRTERPAPPCLSVP